MKKTLLLCFIHGFKGDDDTFASFPAHLRALLTHALPHIRIATITYPTFETRGDLRECVGRFKEWLQNKVIDLEVANRTPSPTVDPSVRVVLVGHSMGGIVAAETALSVAAERPISPPDTAADAPAAGSAKAPSAKKTDAADFMFPAIQGLLAFDTPYLGIAPGVVAHTAEGHWDKASSAWATYGGLAGALGFGATSTPPSSAASTPPATSDALAKTSAADPNADAPAWQKWGRYAMYAGAAGAVAAGGAAAYAKRDALTASMGWVGSHLEFVGCLARAAELESRVRAMDRLSSSRGVGFADIYTVLGKAAAEEKAKIARTRGWSASSALGDRRTFCVVPKAEVKKYFIEARNDRATAETWAHMNMFVPKENPGFYVMSERARDLVAGWTKGTRWYETTEGKGAGLSTEKEGVGEEEVDVEVVGAPKTAPKTGPEFVDVGAEEREVWK